MPCEHRETPFWKLWLGWVTATIVVMLLWRWIGPLDRSYPPVIPSPPVRDGG